jgi:hypothetical protein
MKFEWWWTWTPEMLIRQVTETEVIINRGFVKFLKLLTTKRPAHFQFYDGHPQHRGYAVPRGEFVEAHRKFEQMREKGLRRWNAKPDLEKLVQLLKQCFERNKRAHDRRGWARDLHFDKKSCLLERAIFYASRIEGSGFKWGIHHDGTLGYPYILYFQLGEAQVSFHVSEDLAWDVPPFRGEWIGHPQARFPITKAVIKRVGVALQFGPTAFQEYHPIDIQEVLAKIEERAKKAREKIQGSIQLVKNPIRQACSRAPENCSQKSLIDYFGGEHEK